MRTNSVKQETELRKKWRKAVTGIVLSTWHEDREINPGVPDVSFVVPDKKHETGWIELKACDADQGKIKLQVEPSQHNWIRAHHEHVPIWFLVLVEPHVYLIGGHMHEFVDEIKTVEELERSSMMHCGSDDIRTAIIPFLAMMTERSEP